MEDQTAGNDAGGGDRDTRDREPVPLNRSDDRESDRHNAVSDTDQIADTSISDHAAVKDSSSSDGDDPLRDEQLNKELEDLDTFGEGRDTGYEQMSLFSFHDSVLTEKEKRDVGKYTYLNPKTEDSVPQEYIVNVLKRGTGFVDGKKRVYHIMQTEPVRSKRVRRIKSEFGLGGAGWPLEGCGLHGYDTFKTSKGMRFQWRDEEGEKEGYVSWNAIESILSALILTNDYYVPEPEIETDSPEPETGKETGGVLTEEELDGYAIPDEMEDMGVPDYIRGDNDNTVTVDSDIMEEDTITITDIHEDSETVREGGSDRPEVTGADSMPPEAQLDMEPGNEADHEQPVIINDSKAANFHLSIWDTRGGGAKTRFSWNVEAIKLLKQIEAEGRATTREEQQILAGYVGWGGLSQVFDENNAAWSKEYAELKDLLDDSEYTAARASVNNAFYTPTMVASAVTRALSQFGFRKGNILEPSMGVGNFFGCMPEELSDSRLYGVELDSISSRIAKLLYPDARIEIKGFEETDYPDNFFDVVIGNVPFGDYKIYDPKYNKLNFKVHDYFVAKAIDQARPGGIVAVITTKGTLDKQSPNVRKYLAERAELVGAVRLPTSVFQGSGGTEVTSDILFFQKRERKITIEPDWVHLGFTEDGIPVNSYFAEHAEMMLGKMQYDRGRFGDSSNYAVCVNDDPDFNVYESVSLAIANIHAEIRDFELISDNEEELSEDIPADPDVKNFTFTVVDGSIYYRKDSRMYKREFPLCRT